MYDDLCAMCMCTEHTCFHKVRNLENVFYLRSQKQECAKPSFLCQIKSQLGAE